jgi:Chaperone of endosialidase
MNNQNIYLKKTTLHLRKSIGRSPLRLGFLLMPLALTCFALSPSSRAVTPAPDGGYLGENTAEGTNALFSLTTGFDNTATGFQALFSNTTGNDNTANGVNALVSNTTGFDNTATGAAALYSNTIGSANTANGYESLYSNTTGIDNTANGVFALFDNTTGSYNTASGDGAMAFNSTGSSNTAVGLTALFYNTTGSSNIALGLGAGLNLTTGNNNIDIGNAGVAAESNTIRIGTSGAQTATFIAGIRGVAVAGGQAVAVNANGQLGIRASSARFKDAIKPMDKASEAILALKPVTFRYKKELDPDGIPQFGLVAEEVEKVNPALVVRDADGKVYTVRYEAVNAMLLNEFLKEYRKVEKLQATITELKSTVARQQKDFQGAIAQQQKAMETVVAHLKQQDSKIQKVSAQIELTKPAPQTVLNNH